MKRYKGLLYLFLIFIASCKNGYTPTSAVPNNDILWAFTQALVNRFPQGDSNASFSFTSANTSQKFSVSSSASYSCNSPVTRVRINNVDTPYQPVSCRNGATNLLTNDPFSGESGFYIISTYKISGDTIKYLSFLFPGKSPGNATYYPGFRVDFSPMADYSIFVKRDDGFYERKKRYAPISGSVTTTSLNEKIDLTTLNLLFAEDRGSKPISILANLSCCNN